MMKQILHFLEATALSGSAWALATLHDGSHEAL